MAKVGISEIEAGMTLASDVAERTGKVLLKKGVMITEKHITVFKSWGVLEVDIEGAPEEASLEEKIDPKILDEITARASHHFQHCDLTHPVHETLYNEWIKTHVS